MAAGRSLKFASWRGGWVECCCPWSATTIHAVAVNRTTNLAIVKRTLYHGAMKAETVASCHALLAPTYALVNRVNITSHSILKTILKTGKPDALVAVNSIYYGGMINTVIPVPASSSLDSFWREPPSTEWKRETGFRKLLGLRVTLAGCFRCSPIPDNCLSLSIALPEHERKAGGLRSATLLNFCGP